MTIGGTLTVEDGPPIAWRQGMPQVFIPAAAAASAIFTKSYNINQAINRSNTY
jgi:hypothetical protein